MKKKLLLYFSLICFLPGILHVPDLDARNFSQEEQLILVGIGALNDGFYDIAEKQFSQLIKDYPNHAKLYDICYLLGRTLLLKNKLKESKALFLRIVQENKNFEYMDYTLYWLAEIEIRLGQGEEARKLLLSAIKRFPKFEWIDYTYYLLGLLDFQSNRVPQAEASFKKVPLSSNNYELIQSSLFWLGVLSFRQKDYGGAIGYFHTLWEDPKFLPL